MNADLNEHPEWIVVGRLLRPQGRRGEVLVEPGTDLPDAFAPGRRVRVASPSHLIPPLDASIEESWKPTGRNAGRVVLKLSGIGSISDAEAIAGRDILLQSADLPQLDSDTWFVRDLVGCVLLDRNKPVGEIIGVEYTVGPDGRTRQPDTAPLLEVAPKTAPNASVGPVLVPFVKAWLEAVDIEHKTVTMHLPEGLLTPEEEPASSD